MTKPEPLIVTPYFQRNKTIAAIIDGYHCFFDKAFPLPKADEPIEVMICTNTKQVQDDPPRDNQLVVRSLIIRAITPDDILVHHEGFICSGSQCRTTAAVCKDDPHYEQLAFLSPGRTSVDTVYNLNLAEGEDPKPGRENYAWVSKKDMAEGYRRITGVPSLGALDQAVVARLVKRTYNPAD